MTFIEMVVQTAEVVMNDLILRIGIQKDIRLTEYSGRNGGRQRRRNVGMFLGGNEKGTK